MTPCVGSIHGIYVGAIPCSTLVTNHKAVLCRTTSNDEPVRSIYRLPSNGLEAGLNRSDRAAGPHEATISQPQGGSAPSALDFSFLRSVSARNPRRPHPRAAGPLVEAQVRARPALAATPMWPCECRAARAASRRRRVGCRRASHGPNYGYRGLLRSRCERPRRSAAEQRDELAPFHSITSSAVVAPGGLTDQPPSLATAAPCPNHCGVGSGFIDDQDRPDRLSTSGVLPASTTRSTARSSW